MNVRLTFAICNSKPSNVCIEIFGFARSISNTVRILSTVFSDTFPSRFDSNALPDRNTWLTEPPILCDFLRSNSRSPFSVSRTKLFPNRLHSHSSGPHRKSFPIESNRNRTDPDDVHPLHTTLSSSYTCPLRHTHIWFRSLALHCVHCKFIFVFFCCDLCLAIEINWSLAMTHHDTRQTNRNKQRIPFALVQSMTFDVNPIYWLNHVQFLLAQFPRRIHFRPVFTLTVARGQINHYVLWKWNLFGPRIVQSNRFNLLFDQMKN